METEALNFIPDGYIYFTKIYLSDNIDDYELRFAFTKVEEKFGLCFSFGNFKLSNLKNVLKDICKQLEDNQYETQIVRIDYYQPVIYYRRTLYSCIEFTNIPYTLKIEDLSEEIIEKCIFGNITYEEVRIDLIERSKILLNDLKTKGYIKRSESDAFYGISKLLNHLGIVDKKINMKGSENIIINRISI